MIDTTLTPQRLLLPELPVEASEEQVWELYNLAESYFRRVRDARAAVHGAILDWLDANGKGEIQAGHLKLVAGLTKKQKVRDVAETFAAVVEAAQRDPDRVVGVLSANAYKLGELRKLVGDDLFDALVEVTWERDLETRQLKRELKTIDTRFVTSGARE